MLNYTTQETHMERTSGDFLYIHFVNTKRRPPIATTNIICISLQSHLVFSNI